MGSKLMPPDGGWGWIIVLALALNNIVMIPILQGFGLVFKDRFVNLNMSATDVAIIINVNSAFGMGLGLVNGPLLRIFGYRNIALVGSTIYVLGVIFTAFADTFGHFIITYGIMTSVGITLAMSSFSLALNTYFVEKRGRAMGLAMTVTGVGPIVMPQIISFLLSFYGVQGTVLLLGAYSLHSLVGALLLHPIKWHLKRIEVPRDVGKSLENIAEEGVAEEIRRGSLAGSEVWKRKRTTTISSIDHDVETGSIYGFEFPLQRKKSETVAPPAYRSQHENLDNLESTERPRPDYKWWSSANDSLDAVNLGSCMTIFDETIYVPFVREESRDEADEERDQRNGDLTTTLLDKKHDEVCKKEEEEEKEKKKDNEETKYVSMLHSVILFFDLDLLRDPIYVNIMVGMSLAVFAELNFSLFTPFILSDMQFSTEQIAMVMSTTASLDLVFRGISPFIGEWLRKPPRSMYLFSLLLLIISRTTLMFAKSFKSALIVSVGLGVAKGFRSVYMTLVIPSYVPIERLASASGIQMVVNGFFLMCGGPLLGLIRDKSGSYIRCIIFINIMTSITIIMWVGEMFVVSRIKKKRREREQRVIMQK